jgi:multiple sugar transport system permease protein
MAAAVGYPIVRIVEMAFQNVNSFGISQGFAGFGNFSGLWQSGFSTVIGTTLIWTLGTLIPTVIISMAMALALAAPIKGQAFFRTITLIPWAIPLTIVAILGSMILDNTYGQLNTVLQDLHLISHPIGWLATSQTSLPIMIIIAIWVSIPFTTLTLLSGIQAVPEDIKEAGALDGLSPWGRFWHITLPLTTNAVQLVVLINLAYIFNSFPIIWVLTQGGPAETTSTVTIFTYKLAFTDGEFGYAGAAALIAFVALLVVALLYTFSYRGKEGSLL